MIVISTPEPDTYGQYARASLLADYAELLALTGQSVRRAAIADFLADNEWNLELIYPVEIDAPLLEEPEAPPARLDDADEAASIVFRQLDERRHVLADCYPFDLTDDMISLGRDIDLEASAYVAVLGLTVAHAFNIAAEPRPAELFEQTVTRVLRARGLSSVGLGAVRREAGSFEKALRTACERLGLKAAPDEAPRLVKAHDEGVDVLCHVGWEPDLRPGTWGFIGQVTVGRSDSWRRKIKEPSAATWALLTGTWIQPMPFLAVPHHVERPMMEKLTVDGQAVVLDRLRLVRFKNETNAEEREVIQAVLREEVEPLTG